MILLIQPAEPLTALEAASNEQGSALRLIAARQNGLEALWARMVAAYPLLAPLRESRRAVQFLPANGELIVDVEPPISDSLRQTSWLRVFPDYELPPLQRLTAPVGALATDWHLTSIRKPKGLDGTGIVAGVVDTGIDLALPDHQTRSGRLGFGAFDVMAGLVKAAPPADPDGHGSFVCAFLAGDASGVSPAVHLNVASVPPVLDAYTGARVHRALEWLSTRVNPAGYARSLGCDVVNLSLEIGWPDEWVPDLYQPLLDLRDLFQTFVVAAIGNAMAQVSCPGAYDCVLAAGALTPADRVAAFSSWGSNPAGVARPDLCAPGSEVSLMTAFGPAPMFGTSFSSPIVAGAAALVMQKHPAERLRPDLILNRLRGLVRAIPAAECCPSAAAPTLKVITGAGALDLSAL